MKTAYDAVIVGAGPAGSTAAILLARAGWSVAIVEKHTFPRRKVCGECIAAPNLPLLDALGVGTDFGACAGPELRQVGLFAGEQTVIADLPAFSAPSHAWGRVLGRDYLDELLLRRAADCGARLWQPWRVKGLTFATNGRRACHIAAVDNSAHADLTAPIVIAANGSWEPDPFGHGPHRPMRRHSDLFAFKGNYCRASLAPGLLPVLAIPGGYGGLVLGDHDRVTLAFCLRRDKLRQCRGRRPGLPAAVVARGYVQRHVRGVREALAGAKPAAPWLTVGPIRPGVGSPWRGNGVFAIGNAAGEAHPIMGEGISMALQSAWLLCNSLVGHGRVPTDRAVEEIGRDYDARWRRCFRPRMRFATVFAHMAMHPSSTTALLALLQRWPGLLTRGAQAGGKIREF